MKIYAQNNKKILKMSKLDWVKIGASGKWLKFAEPIEVDGKWYDEKNGELVEINNPSQKPTEKINIEPQKSLENKENIKDQRKSYVDPAYKITFTEGEEYTNWYGTYRVLKINDDKTMNVEYIQSFRPEVNAGEIKTYPINAQAETIFKASRSKEIELKLNNIADFKQPNDFFTMGIIAANGYISAEIGPKHHKKFPEKYKKLTGEDPLKYLNSGYLLSKNEDRWSYTLRVHLPATIPPQILQKMNLRNLIARQDSAEINDNSFIWGLFNNGFSIGRNLENKEKILSSIPSDKKELFLQGFNALSK